MYSFRRLLWEEWVIDGQERGERPVRRQPSREEMMAAEPNVELGKCEWS